MRSAYGNPRPYPSLTLERHELEGRIRVARFIAKQYETSGDSQRLTRWNTTIDELLDHLAEVDARALSAAISEEHGA
jgi:hypothetical protein